MSNPSQADTDRETTVATGSKRPGVRERSTLDLKACD
jgi:hypothetical protein